MTIDRHHYRYVYIDSSNHKLGNDFTVKVPHSLNSCSRVALQSFSIPNTIPNIYSGLNKLYWAEFRKPTSTTSNLADWEMKIFYIDLSSLEGYITNEGIANIINNKFVDEVYDYETKTLSHSFGTSDTTGTLAITFTYNPDTYKFNIGVSQPSLTGNANVKIFVPAFVDGDMGLWENFGFSHKESMVQIGSTDELAFLSYLNTAYTRIYASNTDIPAGSQDQSYYDFNYSQRYARIAGVPSNDTDIVASKILIPEGSATHENHFNGLYLCSDALGTDGLICKNDTATPTNIIAWIINDQPKFSYLHHNTNTPAWMKLNDQNIKQFDIKIRDNRGRDIPAHILPSFNMTLVFEEIDEADFSKEHMKEYFREGYRKAHDYRK